MSVETMLRLSALILAGCGVALLIFTAGRAVQLYQSQEDYYMAKMDVLGDAIAGLSVDVASLINTANAHAARVVDLQAQQGASGDIDAAADQLLAHTNAIRAQVQQALAALQPVATGEVPANQ